MPPPHKVGNDVDDDNPTLPKRRRLEFPESDSDDENGEQEGKDLSQTPAEDSRIEVDQTLLEKAVNF